MQTAGAAVVGLAVGAVAGYAVSASSKSTSTTTITNTVTASAASSSSSTGPAFTYVSTLDPSNLDPHQIVDDPTTRQVAQMYDALMWYGAGGTLEGNIVNTWSSPDAQTWNFTIRRGINFHDGTTLDANAVVYNFQRALAINGFAVSNYSNILTPSNVTATSSDSFQVALSSPYAPFPHCLSIMFIASPTTIKKNQLTTGNYGSNGDYGTTWLQTNDAGGGPYIMTGRKVGSYTTYKAFPDYWGGWKPLNYPTATQSLVAEDATIALMMQSGQAQQTDQWLPVTTYNQLISNNVPVTQNTELNMLLNIKMNNNNKYLQDVNVRQALSYAFDYQTCLNTIWGGPTYAFQCVGPMPVGSYGYNSNLTPYTYNISQAKAALAKSAFSPGEITLTYTSISGLTPRDEMGALLASGAAQIGITVNVVDQEWANVVQACSAVDTMPDLCPVIPAFSINDPDGFLYLQYYSGLWKPPATPSYSQVSLYSNPTVDQLLEQARSTTNEATRLANYAQVQSIINEAAVDIFIVQQYYRIGVGPNTEGFNFYPFAFPSQRCTRYSDLYPVSSS